MRRHIVHSGDSVAKIAQQYGVTVEEVHAVNRIDELYQLYQGRVLRIPVSVTSPVEMNSRVAAVPTSNGSNFVSAETPRTSVTVPREEVVVEVEETPAGIEEPPAVPEVAFEVPRVAVTETPRREAPVVRETYIVTPRETPVVQPRVTPVAQSSNQKTYTVVKGDTAYRISQRFNVKADALLKHNGISDPSKLQIGQTLKIPN